MRKRVPFYSNTKDRTHCFQAALKMILKYFWPQEEFSWSELDKISAKKKGLWTWPLAALIWLSKNGIEINNIEIFDYRQFIKSGEKYLINTFGAEVGKAQIKYSDIKQEKRLAKVFVKSINTKKRLPTIADIKTLLTDGFLVMCNVNSRILNRREGYAGHFVVVVGVTGKKLFLHDPGPPPLKYRRVSFQKFRKAWAYPNNTAKNVMAFRA